ncbi:DUF1801 domain-containing protein [Maribacter sp.]|uniref:DUF1801 domain-containing protein n=1 Tax=Maribacter sp. TaxID=1897614 RepID=UPI00344E3552
MTSDATTLEEYIKQLLEQRKEVISKIRELKKQTYLKVLKECISYKMLGCVVPNCLYPESCHCNPKLPLPFINLASQKNFVALYRSGIYADVNLYGWFVCRGTP